MDRQVNLYEDEYMQPRHFSFGKNWLEYLRTISTAKLDQAEASLAEFLAPSTIQKKVFYDIGFGSGIFSLAAIRLGASRVASIDADSSSVESTTFIKGTYAPSATQWTIMKGSILDDAFIAGLPLGDIVYSWGVLHHTGDMWRAIANASRLVRSGGLFYLAIYNHSRSIFEGNSAFWYRMKRFYNHAPAIVQQILFVVYSGYLIIGLGLKRKQPIRYIKSYSSVRGMDFFSDVRDWLGGYPYEYATVEEITDFMNSRGFEVVKTTQARSIGCNEYLFRKRATTNN